MDACESNTDKKLMKPNLKHEKRYIDTKKKTKQNANGKFWKYSPG